MARVELRRCFEVYIDASPEVCAERDPKGLYALARAGEFHNLTGWDAPYEAPYSPAIHIRTAATPIGESAEQIVRHYLNVDHHAE
jgi:adenylylsulfate kinase-like enzyme